MLFKNYLFLLIFLSINVYADEFSLGVASRLLTNKPKEVDAFLATNLVFDNKLKFIRMDASWSDVEVEKGVYRIPKGWDEIIDYQINKGIEPILILAYGNKFYSNSDKPITSVSIEAFKKYVSFVTNHFSGKVKYYQIWNEWNGSAGSTKPGNVSEYKKLVKDVYPLIKENSPSSLVITGEFSNGAFNKSLGLTREDYLKDFLTDDMATYTDIIGIHPYVAYRTPPYNSYAVYLAQVNYAMKLIRENKLFKKKPLFITEIGWSTSNTSHGVSQFVQAEYLAKAICDAKSIGVSAVIIYNLKDSPPSVKHPTEPGFGIYDVNWNPKTIINKLQNISC